MAKKKAAISGEDILRVIEKDRWPTTRRAEVRRSAGRMDIDPDKAVEAWEQRRKERIAERNRTRQRAYRKGNSENLRRGRRFVVFLSRGDMYDLSHLLIESLTEKQVKEFARMLNKAIRTKS